MFFLTVGAARSDELPLVQALAKSRRVAQSVYLTGVPMVPIVIVEIDDQIGFGEVEGRKPSC